ncbi:phosphate acyltransferase PlsX [Rubeoparvulum massiliense]|uniref:phosphate acyltransferase PlsX n=1 Tax=Rubeoparvulum massiliense TaxID=1631346 RepID=UPI00065E5C49|nr:phosphate acyltransferase PlsX [Rubeoparvulum massiliense]
MRIVVDAMGGDHAPHEIVKGVLAAQEKWPNVHYILVGRKEEVRPLIEGANHLELIDAPEVIATDDEPTRAIRRKKDSSLVVATQLLQEQKADAMISAGNTGALMAAGLFIVGRMQGVERPGLGTVFPTMDGKGCFVIDLGANVDAKPQHLYHYAILGHAYMEEVMGCEHPRIGLLNVGTEDKKGNMLTKEVFQLLKESELNFVGNVEARDVLNGVCDVLVCDGFSGNVMLKSIEGVAATLFSILKEELTKTTMRKLAAATLKPGLRNIKNKLDYKEHGGAPLLGLQAPLIKAHGSSDARAIENAIGQAIKMIESQYVQRVMKHMEGMNEE